MGMFLVRRSLPDLADQAIRAALERCGTHAEELAATGHHVRYIGCAYVAADGFCGCVYEATSVETVRLATERAAVPYDEIVAVIPPGSPHWPAGSSTNGSTP
jgi:Protein of unknown function (DUF4242)